MHAFDVLGDPVRRRILELLTDGELPSGTITAIVQAEFGISQPAVSQHLRVLRQAGLVTAERVGTRHVYRADPRGLAELRAYFDDFWNDALDAYKREVER